MHLFHNDNGQPEESGVKTFWMVVLMLAMGPLGVSLASFFLLWLPFFAFEFIFGEINEDVKAGIIIWFAMFLGIIFGLWCNRVHPRYLRNT